MNRSVDRPTAALMHQIISAEFAGCTVLETMHDLKAVMDYDMVAVFQEGRLLEFDRPETLLGRPGAVFAELYSTMSSGSERDEVAQA